MVILQALDNILFVYLALNVLYLFVFSVASCFKTKRQRGEAQRLLRMAFLIPAYKEDAVIQECVASCLAQHYPTDLFDVVVISDRMEEETNQSLASLPIHLIIAQFEESTKTKALNLAMDQLAGKGYEIAIILDADNVIEPTYLDELNRAFESPKYQVYQTHRIAKNRNTRLSVLDAVSEEVNNSIFRKGHVNLGFSSGLIGSGMAFEFELLKEELAEIKAVGGFDRALEFSLFMHYKKIGYLTDTIVRDEKIQNKQDFSNQRRRWMSAQVHYLKETIKGLPGTIFERNADFWDKLLQHILLPRVILMGVLFLLTLFVLLIAPVAATKWCLLFGLLVVTMMLAIPHQLYNMALLKAAIALPVTFFYMFLNLFRLKGANKRFIHTKHGIK